MDDEIVARVREICVAFPEAHERETWESPTFRVRGKIIAILQPIDGGPTIWT